MLIEKDNLLPFEEAKLFGHNAIHALMAYLGAYKGYAMMSELRDDSEIMQIARDAFILESGAALIKKYSDLGDDLFTESGFKEYAEDLLERMTNPYLEDTVERAARDPQRKLGLNDRLFGTMQLCLQQGIEPSNIAMGAAAGIRYLQAQKQSDSETIESVLRDLWDDSLDNNGKLLGLVKEADLRLGEIGTRSA